jgi:acyl transferase domain-containing protein/NAD(P)H-dependent flavin oxidoreductase YrpB (nitropropane dioxygenase family)/NAD(P)-dependent dehydrogenase (short-subunit alcohol dehydrogenase family)
METVRAFEIVVVGPPGVADASLAVAAGRAGAVGILDLTGPCERDAAGAAVERLAREGRGRRGLRLGRSGHVLAPEPGELPPEITFAVLAHDDPDELRRQALSLRRAGREIWLEAVSAAAADTASELGAGALIVKGNESGGRVGDATAFTLTQALLARTSLPLFVQGGIGSHTAAACFTAGAAGVVLGAQLYLTREAGLPDEVRSVIARMDGSETICLSGGPGASVRVYHPRAAGSASGELRELADALRTGGDADEGDAFVAAVEARLGWGPLDEHAWPLGQDACFAAPLAARHRTAGRAIRALRAQVDAHVASAAALSPLRPGAPLARSHGTEYPIVQGPMTRVSDSAPFALRVAESGGLPLLALALMHAPEVESLLERTRDLLRDRPWGVGILGFVPLELRREQLEVVRRFRPPFALIAGGRAEQALSLEEDGIATYLHAPSPHLLELFLERGARRFVFEGSECGGHVGPRSSFVLWETMIDTILASDEARDDLADLHVLFAGGVHDELSAAMVATLAAPLAERGARVGVLLGTAYLFTEDALATGAIVPGFQNTALGCARTILLETGPGHSTRCAATPFGDVFDDERRRLAAEGRPPAEAREELERLNLGRLRIASKGIARRPDGLVEVASAEQLAGGMYMMGQVATLRRRTTTIADVHRAVSADGCELLATVAQSRAGPAPERERPGPSDVAIVGMGCLLPKARDVAEYWSNILAKVDAITEVPEDRWDWHRLFDPDPAARDRISSRWGGFLDDVVFDPTSYGMPPASLPSIEPLQLLTLEVVRSALADAGYLDESSDRERTSVILGAGGGIADLGQQYAVRSGLPLVLDDVPESALERLPEWTEDSFAGILLNVAAGRVANRFDLGGVNYTVDAACASSLAAVHLGVRELEAGTSDMVVVGGCDTVQNPFGYLCFSKTHALSPTGRCRTFDEHADGIAISEGIGVLILKRLTDAERDGDRIYAVIKAVAGSSDGRARGLTAPRPEGQVLALERAYEKAGFSPAGVTLVEAHGTGTVAGDRAEIETLRTVFEAAGARRQSCAVGSVKSMIGHTKCTAGVAGLIKVALALHHKVLPPTLNVERPSTAAGFPESPFYVNSEPRPWIHDAGQPRRAGVSAFGFGGTNFHAVLEEYPDAVGADAVAPEWPAELLVWSAESRADLVARIDDLAQSLAAGAGPALRDLAFTLWNDARERGPLTLAIVAASVPDLREKLDAAGSALRDTAVGRVEDPRGIYYADEPLARDGRVAFLFPGQGSQACDMLGELAVHFPEVRERFEAADAILGDAIPEGLSSYMFPPPRFDPGEAQLRERELTRTEIAQPALGVAGVAVARLLDSLGVRPELAAGHSYGEYVALHSAGVLGERELYLLSRARGRSIVEAASGRDLGTMAVASEGAERVAEIIAPVEGALVANVNAPRQTVVSGTQAGVAEAVERLRAAGVQAKPIPVACAFHSPLVAEARDRLAGVLAETHFAAPRIEVFSNTTAERHANDPDSIAALLADHLVEPVRFLDEVEAMAAAGASVFVESGPNGVLTGLVDQILGDRPHLAVAVDAPGRRGVAGLLHALGRLAADGVPVELDRLFAGRSPRRLTPEEVSRVPGAGGPPATAWLVNGGSVRPVGATAPVRRAPPASAPGASDLSPARDAPDQRPSAPVPRTVPARHEPELPSVAAAPATDGEVAAVMSGFQHLMTRFLETEERLMLAFLGSPAAAAPEPAAATSGEIAPDGWTDAAEAEASPVEDVPPVLEDAAPRDVLGDLVRIVGERTGYPPEMLDPDINLESELGIDSIKLVEILGAILRAALPPGRFATEDEMEQLTARRTLRAIADAVGRLAADGAMAAPGLEPAPPDPRVGEAAPVPEAPPPAAELPRFRLVPVEAPRAGVSAAVRGTVLVTDDGGGVAAAVASRLEARGARVVLARMPSNTGIVPDGTLEADLRDAAAVEELVEAARRRAGPIAGIVHALPLAAGEDFEEMDARAVRERLSREALALFHLVRAAAADLKQAGGWVVAATAMGGDFGLDGAAASLPPTHGAVAGFLKSLGREWPAVRTRVVDLSPADGAAELADRLASELPPEGDEVEIGYRASRRTTPRPIRAEVGDAAAAPRLAGDAVVLVTGGARGITAEVAKELAQTYRPTLVLVGRSPLPGPEEPETAARESAADLRAALIERARAARRGVTPAEVEAEHAALLGAREIRANLAAMERAGATVDYRSVDVSDESAFAGLIDDVYASYGRLDGVVHGAGVIEDRLVGDKTVDSFVRVLEPKVVGAHVLARRLRPDSLRFLVFFSSVAATFGNRGQCDYAAANEVLGKLAHRLDARWPARVVALDWGPWSDRGMVSEAVAREFAARGVELIAPDAGRRAFDRELRSGRKGEAEIVLGSGPWADAAPAGSTSTAAALRSARPANGVLEIAYDLDPVRDRYLEDHRLDGRPVLPAAMAAELLAELALVGWPGADVVELRDLQVLKGVVLSDGRRRVRLVARPGADDDGRLLVHAELREEDAERPAYAGVVVLAERYPEAPRPQLGRDGHDRAVDSGTAYRELLFHGPRFQCLHDIVHVGAGGCRAVVQSLPPAAWLAEPLVATWTLDPLLLDAAPQLAIVWARSERDETALPSRMTRIRRFRPPSATERLSCVLDVRARPGDPVAVADAFYVDDDGEAALVVEGLESTCRAALNRLAGEGAVR